MNKRLAFVYHDDQKKHYATYDHPESPERTRVIREAVESSPLVGLVDFVEPQPALLRQVMTVHPSHYLKRLDEACKRGNFWFDFEDTFINSSSYESALLSAGSAIKGVDEVLMGNRQRAFCCTRPPGHHAEPERGMGFCLLNNVAIAAMHAKRSHGLDRILIVDWDVHHGNGTERVFEEDPDVFYISIHEHPSYIFPGTGRRWEKGKGAGSGFTLNIPLPPGSGDSEYISSMEENIIPAIEEYSPQLIILSAGFDAHRSDPLGDMDLSEEGFGEITRRICLVADSVSQGRVVSVLEGGYHLDSLKQSALVHLERMTFCEEEETCLSGEE